MNKTGGTKMKKITAVILVTLAMLFSVAPAQSIIADNNVTREEFEVGPLQAGETTVVEFEPGVDPEGIITTEGISFQKVDGRKYTFVADTDIDGGRITLWKKVENGETETEHESGESNQVGTPGEGEGEETSWGSFELGKITWEMGGGEVQFAIRIDVSRYQGYEYIYVQDLPDNLDNVNRFSVSKLEPNEDNIIVNTGGAEYEEVSVDEGFALKIKVDELLEGENMVYDIAYFMDIVDVNEKFSNSYRVYTVEEWEKVTSGGNAGGTTAGESTNPGAPGNQGQDGPDTNDEDPEGGEVVNEDDPKGEDTSEKEGPKEETKDEPTEEEGPKDSVEEEETVEELPKEESKEEPKEESKDKPKDKPKEEPKEDVSEEESTEDGGTIETVPSVEGDKEESEVLPPTGVANTKLVISVAMISLGLVLIKKRK